MFVEISYDNNKFPLIILKNTGNFLLITQSLCIYVHLFIQFATRNIKDWNFFTALKGDVRNYVIIWKQVVL